MWSLDTFWNKIIFVAVLNAVQQLSGGFQRTPVFHIYEVDSRDFWPTAKNNCVMLFGNQEKKQNKKKNTQSALEIET